MICRRIHILAAIAFVLSATRVVLASRVELYHLPGFHEPFSAISHIVGFVLFVYLGWRLCWRGYRYCCEHGHPKKGRMLVLGLYAFSCILLMSMSALFHMVVRNGAAHRVMERLDHSAIFILIAGTITPIQGLLFRGRCRAAAASAAPALPGRLRSLLAWGRAAPARSLRSGPKPGVLSPKTPLLGSPMARTSPFTDPPGLRR